MELSGEVKVRLQRKKMYSSVFGTKEGEAVLADLYRFCGMSAEAYTPGSFDQTAYNEGRQRVGKYIQRLLNQNEADIQQIAQSQMAYHQGDLYDVR